MCFYEFVTNASQKILTQHVKNFIQVTFRGWLIHALWQNTVLLWPSRISYHIFQANVHQYFTFRKQLKFPLSSCQPSQFMIPIQIMAVTINIVMKRNDSYDHENINLLIILSAFTNL